VRMIGWRDCKLGDVVNLKRGYDLPQSQRAPGPVPIISSSGITDHHAIAKVQGPGVVTGRYGTLGEVFYVDRDFWPLNTTLYVQDFKGNDPRFISYLLRQLDFGARNAAGAVPGIKRNHLHTIEIRLPPLSAQRYIASILSAYDELITNNQQRARVLEDIGNLFYREWFVHHRIPGHRGRTTRRPRGKFGDLATIQRDGINPFEFPSEEFEHFSIPAFDAGGRPFIERGETILSNKYCLDGSTVL